MIVNVQTTPVSQCSAQLTTGVGAFTRMLDEAQAAILRGGGEIDDAVWRLVYGLASVRARASKAEWKSCVACCRQHLLLPMLHEDPYVARAYQKPRGYPGDAGVIDFLYRISPLDSQRPLLTKTGQLLLDVTTTLPSAFAVRERRRLAAKEIDTVAAEKDRPTILSVAAGHLREATCSEAVLLGRVGRFIAVDQDQESLDTIRTDYGNLGVECRRFSVRDILHGVPVVDHADLIYALGLCDYLSDSVAKRLTATLLRMLAPGGRLLLANFMPGIPEAGYMEAISDWYLAYRTPSHLQDLASGLGEREELRREVWTDDFGSVVYIRISRSDHA